MKQWYLVFFFIISFFLFFQGEIEDNSQDTQEADTQETQEKENKDISFLGLVKLNSEKLNQDYSATQAIPKTTLLKILWSGNGLIQEDVKEDEKEESKEKNNKEKKSKIKYTHPVNFSSLIELYYVDQNGIYQYVPKKNELKLLQKTNIINQFAVAETANYKSKAYIIVALNPSQEELYKGIDSFKGQFNNDVLDRVKESYSNTEKIKQSAIIEAGMATKNIMFMASICNLSHYPIPLLKFDVQEKMTKALNLSKIIVPFMLIPLANGKKPSNNNSLSDYLTNLIKSGENSKKSQFDLKNPLSQKDVLELMWAGNGILTYKDQKLSSHSIGTNSAIELYYINRDRVDKYNPITQSMFTLKMGDYRHRLGKIAEKYKTPESIILTIKTDIKAIQLNEKNYLTKGISSQAADYYNRIITSGDYSKYLGLFQVGMAIQNIRLRATDMQVAYQHIEIADNLGAFTSEALSLKDNDFPVFVIPIGKKTSGENKNSSKAKSEHIKEVNDQ